MKVYIQKPNQPKTRRLIGDCPDELESWEQVCWHFGLRPIDIVGGHKRKKTFILVSLR